MTTSITSNARYSALTYNGDEAYQYLAEVIAGTKPMLSQNEAVALMPAYPV